MTSLERCLIEGQKAGCPQDQMGNFLRVGVVLQPRQLVASGAARLCDCADGPTAVGYGKKYPEFWINHRPDLAVSDNGVHVALRAPSAKAVDIFHAVALNAGGSSYGAPGPRPGYSEAYYAAFVCDPDGNRIEAVTFMEQSR